MQVGDVSQALGGAGLAGGAGGTDELGKEEFLRLLTAQLNNQDPLSPMDNTAFVSQLAEFSGLEQMMNVSKSVEQLAIAQAVNNGSNMVSFIGKDVTYLGDSFNYDGAGGQDLAVDLAGDADKVTVTVYDSDGKLVRTFESGPMESGNGSVNWDGTDDQGRRVGEGQYTFKVSAEDKNGDRVEAVTRKSGRVEGVTYASGYPELLINGERVPVGEVVEVIDSGAAAPVTSKDGETAKEMVSAGVGTSYNAPTSK